MKLSLTAVAVLACVLGIVIPAGAQVNTATVYATVADSTGAVIPGATVTLTHSDTGVASTRSTNEVGNASFDFLPVGTYTVEIESDGFKKFSGQNFALSAGQTVRQTFAMEVGQITEVVTVEDIAPLVQTSAAEQVQTFEARKVAELPLGRRNFTGLLRVNTGVTPVTGGSGSGVRMNGIGRNGTAFAVDGGEASSNPEGRGASVYQAPNYIDIMSIEGVQEVQMVKGTVPAEYGNLVGGQVQLVTKSGTNEWHGSLFHGIRADNLNATNSFLKSRGIGKTPQTFNQFGGSVGGPIVKNKAFIFSTYEGYQERRLRQVDGNVPTAQLRERMVAAVPGYQSVLSFFPLPNQPHDPEDTDGVFIDVGSERREDNHVDIKGDIRLGSQSNLALTYARGRPFRYLPRIHLNGSNDRTWEVVQERGTASYVIGGTSWTSESRFTYSINDSGRLDQFFLQQFDNGLSEEQEFDNRLPRFSTNLGWGGPGAELFLLEGYTVNISEKFAKHIGNHSFKFGGSYVGHCCRRSNPENPSMRFVGLQDLLDNVVTEVVPTFGTGDFVGRMFEIGFFVQDDWRVNDRLTLNLGLRYDFISNMVATPDGGSDSAFRNADGLLDDSFNFGPLRDPENPYDNDSINIGPRIGMAYKIDQNARTVLRAGFGTLFSPLTPGLAWQSVGRLGVPFRTRFQKAEAADLGLRFGTTTGELRKIVATRNASGEFRDTFSYFDPGLEAPYSMHWHFGLQRQLARDMVLETSYVANRGIKFPMHRRANNIIRTGPNAGQKPNPNLAITYYVDSSQTTMYHSWQSSLRKRYGKRHSFSLHYTWGKALSDNGGDVGAYYQGDNNGGIVQDFFNLRAEWGPSAGDTTHYFASEWLVDLPSMRGSGAIRHVLGGWQVSAILSAHTGQPFRVGQGSAIPGSRPDYVGGEATHSNFEQTLQYLNKDAFAKVALDPVSRATVRPGNLGNNALRGIGRTNLDLGIGKNFSVTESVNLRIRADLFSAFNSSTLSRLNTNINSGTFGRLRGSYGERVIQINTRLTF